MKKSKRIKSKQEFDKFIKTTKYIKNSFYVLHFSKKKMIVNRFGIAVGTSVGNAVTRNLLKRRTKEIIKESQNLFKKDLDYIIIVRKRCVELSYQEMKESLINLIKMVK